ncbi:hypothetical protein THIOSC15_1840003 [uncultured Thiomicrorhabdus sp.]
MSDYGIKASGSDDSLYALLDEELQFNSKYSSLKLFKWGDASFTTDGAGAGTATIAHGLGYQPIAIAFRKYTASWDASEGLLPATEYPEAFSHIGALNWYGNGNRSIDFRVRCDDYNLFISDGGIGNLAANTKYDFRYYILVDLAQSFSASSNITLTGNHGIKVAKENKDVLSGKEYNMDYSSKYKALQYYDGHILSQDITLPAMWASAVDEYVSEVTYVDFLHNLGYPPFYLAYMSDGSKCTTIPYYSENGIDIFNYNVAGFCDKNRVRIYFWRASSYLLGTVYDTWSSETLTIKCIMFAENLMGEASP